MPATIVGFDPFADVALLEVEPDGFDLHPLQLGDDDDLVVGQPVAAIGSPFGEQQSLSVGVVSATDRSVESLTKFQIEGAIQTDASINPGNSGGPLLDAGARVLGINEQIETNSGSNSGVGFAVPVSAIKRSVAQLEEDGEAEYAYIGVSTQPLYPQLADKLGLDTDHGGLLSEVVPGSPADKAGPARAATSGCTFQATPYETGGDVILSVDGHQVVAPDDLARYISAHQPGRNGHARGPARRQAQAGQCDIGQTTTGLKSERPPGDVELPDASGSLTRPEVPRRLHPHRRQGDDRTDSRAGGADEGPPRSARQRHRFRRRRLGDPLHDRAADARHRPRRPLARDLRQRGVLQRDQAAP